MFGGGNQQEWACYLDIINIFCSTSGMEISSTKSCFIAAGGIVDARILELFPYPQVTLENGFHYLGYTLKPNGYSKLDRNWLLERVDQKIGLWCYK